MQRKPGFPVANCSIKMPDGMPVTESVALEEDGEQAQRRQQLINFGHTQWGFNNWSWSVTKQDLDFVDFANGKYCAGVVAFVSITVKSLDIHRENIGYATSLAPNKGSAIYKSRKCAVTNALRETLLSFGGSVATELTELLEPSKSEYSTPAPDPLPENNPNVANTLPHTVPSTLANLPSSSIPTVTNSNAANNAPVKPEVKNIKRKDSEGSVANVNGASVVNSVSGISVKPRPAMAPGVKNQAAPPVARAQPMPAPAPAARPLAAVARAPAPRPNSNDKPLESMSEEEARAERKRRQQRAQEEFRLKQLMKAKDDTKQDLQKSSNSFDNLLMDIPTQDIEIEQTAEESGKRKSPAAETSAKRRPGIHVSRLDIVTD